MTDQHDRTAPESTESLRTTNSSLPEQTCYRITSKSSAAASMGSSMADLWQMGWGRHCKGKLRGSGSGVTVQNDRLSRTGRDTRKEDKKHACKEGKKSFSSGKSGKRADFYLNLTISDKYIHESFIYRLSEKCKIIII